MRKCCDEKPAVNRWTTDRPMWRIYCLYCGSKTKWYYAYTYAVENWNEGRII